MEIFNIEEQTREQLYETITETLDRENHSKRNHFRSISQYATKRHELLQMATAFMPIELKEHSPYCLYCEENIQNHDLYCDDGCRELHQEERNE